MGSSPAHLCETRKTSSPCRHTARVPRGCEPSDFPGKSDGYCRPGYRSQKGESCTSLHQNPPNPPLPASQTPCQGQSHPCPPIDPGALRGSARLLLCQIQAGTENSGSAPRLPETNPDDPAGRDQPWLSQDKAGTGLLWLRQE